MLSFITLNICDTRKTIVINLRAHHKTNTQFRTIVNNLPSVCRQSFESAVGGWRRKIVVKLETVWSTLVGRRGRWGSARSEEKFGQRFAGEVPQADECRHLGPRVLGHGHSSTCTRLVEIFCLFRLTSELGLRLRLGLLGLLEAAGEVFKVVQSNFTVTELVVAGQSGTEVGLVGLGARGGGAGPHHGGAGPGHEADVRQPRRVSVRWPGPGRGLDN